MSWSVNLLPSAFSAWQGCVSCENLCGVNTTFACSHVRRRRFGLVKMARKKEGTWTANSTKRCKQVQMRRLLVEIRVIQRKGGFVAVRQGHGSCRNESYSHFFGTSQIQAKKFGFLSKCPLVTGAIKGSPPAPHPLAHRLRVPQEGLVWKRNGIHLGDPRFVHHFLRPQQLSRHNIATVCPTVCLGCVRKIPSMESGGACGGSSECNHRPPQ